MTAYLVDENVLKEMVPNGNKRVLAWAASVPDSDLRISVVTFFEKRRGWEARLRKDPNDATAKTRLEAVAALQKAYAGRLLPIDEAVMEEWARLLGTKGNNMMDVALAATARVHGLVVATRNVKHFLGRGVEVLDPFQDPPRRYKASA